jgi:hypothetical protein
MRRTILLLLAANCAFAGTFPDSPGATRSAIVEYEVHNAPAKIQRDSPVVDWSFLAVHSAYASALVFDDLMTSRGVSHGCAEANPDLGPRPSTKQLAVHGAIEFGFVVAGDVGLKALGKHLGAPAWLSRTFGSLGAAIGTGKHIQGGIAWTRTNCL